MDSAEAKQLNIVLLRGMGRGGVIRGWWGDIIAPSLDGEGAEGGWGDIDFSE